MGYWGHLILERSRQPVGELPEVAAFGSVREEKQLEDGWRLLRVAGATPDLRLALAPLAAATAAPVLVAYVLDSDCALIEAQGQSGLRWTGVLNREVAAADYQAPLPDYDDPDRAVLQALEWSRQAGLTPSEDLLRRALSEQSDFAEDLLDILLAGLGIPGAQPPGAASS